MQEDVPWYVLRPETLGVLQVHCRSAAGALVGLKLIGDLLAFLQAAHAGALERRGVNEHVLAAVVGLNETITLGFIVPLHGSRFHGEFLFTVVCTWMWAKARHPLVDRW